MELVTHPQTGLTVGTLTRTGARRRMVMLWDGAGRHLRTEWHCRRRDALESLAAHCQAVIGPEHLPPWLCV